jgi:hypothetical protein
MNQERSKVVCLVRQFIQGNVGPYEWDDFLSIPLKDTVLEQLRITCVELPKTHPPTDRNHYCSPAGLMELEKQIQRIEPDKSLNSG